MDGREHHTDLEEAIRAALDGRQAAVWTSMPGYIVSYDPTGNGTGSPTATVQLGILGRQLAKDGTTSNVKLPILPDVPVEFPNGGGVTLTFPIQPGDECVVEFMNRNIDYWWQSGGIQSVGPDRRMHDINDGICRVGVRTGKRPLSNVSTTHAQFRSDDGANYVDIDPAGGIVNVVAVNTISWTAPNIVINGNLEVVAFRGSAGSATFAGSLAVTGDVVAGEGSANVSLLHHEHSDPQGGNTGPPV